MLQLSVKRVQPLFSALCGLHCLYYLASRNSGIPFSDTLKTYSGTNYNSNDVMVKKFCKETFNYSMSKRKADTFLTDQISREMIKNL